MKLVHVIDYGIGNLFNVVRALKHLNFEVKVCKNGEELKQASTVVLPGVGAFADCMQALSERNFIHVLNDHVSRGGFLLGICVGMQVLADFGEEFGLHQGLGYIPGRVKHLTAEEPVSKSLKIPHVGWATLLRGSGKLIAADFLQKEYYFVHSYKFCPLDKLDEVAKVQYGEISIPAIIQRGNVMGVQFHPEKSGEPGLNLLKQTITNSFVTVEKIESLV